MRILALETSDRIGGAAALDDHNVLLELDLPTFQRSAQSLLPKVAELLDSVGWRIEEVELIGVGIGPGSFTGLRVGVVAAKVLAYALGAGVQGVNTLEAIAAGCPAPADRVTAVIDAQRGDVVAQSFSLNQEGLPAALGSRELLAADKWIARLKPGETVAGTGLAKLAKRLPPEVRAVAAELWRPRAAMVGRLAAHYWTAGRRDDPWTLAPVYFRPSAAEEKFGSAK
jgi:tRNA threonylcarbamoyladenosine biosynthesis protein TsaB